MFGRLLIANRGEIAIRIARAAADLGIVSVAVHTADDSDAPHVAAADEVVALHGTGVPGYLDIDDVLHAADRAQADAIHPGYGFLSENPRFAEACAARGIRLVGPPPEILTAFGDKVRARELAEAAGLPVLASAAPDGAATMLAETGAVVVKAVAGGGGRGMRRVTDATQLAGALARCASEARSAFGDDRVYVEELLAPARHIEVQLLGDGTGAVTHLGERDCSVQRRHQKLVEIAPAPGLDPAVRERLLAAAVRLGESVRYAGLGTVEFLVSGKRIAFIEVNPRLQVEHTVTEEVTGVDLVQAQIRLAAGFTLADIGLAQDEVAPPRGAALQARIALERTGPDGSTTPTGGTLTAFDLPSGRGIRVDAAGYTGYHTNPRYDSLIAKVIAHGPDHHAATRRASRALSEVRINGVETNIDVLDGIIRHPDFAAGALTTDFLDQHLTEVLTAVRPRRHATDRGPVQALPEAQQVDQELPGEAVRATIPGTVVSVEAAEGQTVRAGQTLVVIEAMKMEHVVAAAA
ncbi:MAG: carbamoyl-phosphate synthase large subunit, partial [Pseudonocardia sp.]|nr:carbamoyl-phosphate synthase large subunit [Pseudonocardia sp.]